MRRCVYTVLTGGYERLNDQKMALVDPEIPFICLTDDSSLRSGTWQIRPFAPMFANDPFRSQRGAKLLAHRVLPDFDASIYIDNAVLLQAPPAKIFEAAGGAGLALPAHSFRATLREEFIAVAEQRLDDPARITEQLTHYRAAFPDLLSGALTWNGILIRDHRDQIVAATMEIWLAHLCRYSRRDQLSAAAAFRLAGLTPTLLEIDNYESWLHSWPHAPERKQAQRLWPDSGGHAERWLALEIALEAQKRETGELEQRLARLTADHLAVLNSTTWRMFAPARALARRLRRI
jgi:hypothetical protein